MPQQQVYDQFAAPGAPQMQMQYGVRALYTPPHNQYDQFAVPPPPRTQMQYGVQSPYTPPDEPYSQFGVQAPSTYPQLSGPVEAGAASFYRTQGCMQDPVGKWFKLLPGFDKRTYHFTPLRILPNREIVAIVDGKVIWPEAARIAYGVAPQGSTSGQFMNRSMPAAFPIRDTSVYQQNMPVSIPPESTRISPNLLAQTMTNNIPAGMPMQNMPAYQQNLPVSMPSGRTHTSPNLLRRPPPIICPLAHRRRPSTTNSSTPN